MARERITTTADQIYGEIFIADNATGQSIPSGATYTKITQVGTIGINKGITMSGSNSNATIVKAGKYKIEATASTKADIANVVLRTSVFVNNTRRANISSVRRIANANDNSTISIGGLLSLNAGDIVDIRVVHDNPSSVTITCENANINLIYIGD